MPTPDSTIQVTSRWQRLASIVTFLLITISVSTTFALDHVTYKRDGKTATLDGKVLLTAVDGGVMLQAADGQIYNIDHEELVSRKQDDEPFNALSAAEIRQQLLTELPAGFETHITAHYVIAYNTSRAYAQWCGALFERLYTAFTNFWMHRGFKLHEAETPLVVIVYADRQTYARHSADEIGGNASRVIGYYSLPTNRIKTYDLSGVEALRQPSAKRADSAQVNELLSRPEATSMVSTVIHEATHQIAFNCGLQERFADIPVWLSEGLAMYFETPDLGFGKGWRTIGAVNEPRLELFQQYVRRRPADSLVTLISDDRRFRSPNGALDAYGEAWSLNYFLIRQRPKEYMAYIERLAKKKPLILDEPAQRLADFKACFGNDLATLDAEFLRYISKIK
jgi:hypothetical protein